MSEGLVRRRPSSPAPAPLPEDDDLLREIFLRLAPLPSSLPRASLVCRRWRRLLSDPQFLHRFRAFHHRQPPLLGCFVEEFDGPRFTPTLDPPDRIPTTRFALPLSGDEGWSLQGFRHGLALLLNRTRSGIIVWDPVTGDQRCVAVPPGFSNNNDREIIRAAALLCDDGHAGCHHLRPFKVVLLRTDNVLLDANPQVFASLYESKTGVWGDLISASIKAQLFLGKPSILVGNSLCWLLVGYRNNGILNLDLDRQSLAVIDTPMGAHSTELQILRMEDSSSVSPFCQNSASNYGRGRPFPRVLPDGFFRKPSN